MIKHTVKCHAISCGNSGTAQKKKINTTQQITKMIFTGKVHHKESFGAQVETAFRFPMIMTQFPGLCLPQHSMVR